MPWLIDYPGWKALEGRLLIFSIAQKRTRKLSIMTQEASTINLYAMVRGAKVSIWERQWDGFGGHALGNSRSRRLIADIDEDIHRKADLLAQKFRMPI